MKHILGMVGSSLDFRGRKAPKTEFEYLRLVHAVNEMRREGEDAMGYFIVIADATPDCALRWERSYRGRQRVETINVALTNHGKRTTIKGTTHDLSRMAVAALSDEARGCSNENVRRGIEESILIETILGLEPRAKRVTDENKFPLGIRWHYYGVVDERKH